MKIFVKTITVLIFIESDLPIPMVKKSTQSDRRLLRYRLSKFKIVAKKFVISSESFFSKACISEMGLARAVKLHSRNKACAGLLQNVFVLTLIYLFKVKVIQGRFIYVGKISAFLLR